MTSAAPASRPVGVRRASRDAQQPVIGGVAAGLARHLAVSGDVGAGRLRGRRGCSAASASLFYAGLWLVLPAGLAVRGRGARASRAPPAAGAGPGGSAGSRDVRPGDRAGGARLRCGAARRGRLRPGRGLLAGRCSRSPASALLWRQADEAQRERWLDSVRAGSNPVRAVLRRRRLGGVRPGRAPASCCCVLALVLFAVARRLGRDGARRARSRRCSRSSGSRSSSGPWVYRLTTDLAAERAERVRTQERADLAAHLHDSVLQTLALIQKNAGDAADRRPPGPRAGARPARLAVRRAPRAATSTLAGALRERGREIEDTHGVDVEVVTVGDCDLDEALRPIVAAAREAVDQRRQARRHRPRRRLRRGVAGRGRRLRARPRRGLRPRGGRRRPARRPQQHRRPDGAPRRHRRGPLRARRGHRGAAAPAPAGHPPTTGGPTMSEPVRVVVVDDHAMFRARGPRRAAAGGAGWSTSSPRPPTSTRRWPRSPSTGPTSCCSTCTCPAAGEPR